MRDIWTIGPTAAAHALRACGFSQGQADCLVALRLRYDRGSFRELTTTEKRLLFIRWLVERGRLNEGGVPIPALPYQETRHLPR